ncbi:helix-turn-helix domain-containing protein [Alkalicoccobacillus gibsonii]|uniref:Helix-turn-helix domain-containing protein n=1 Tax=Alkalicoccobacillus gibsonii TaxID=79881 RepID=A0ABU9VNM8_9BACI
MYEYRNLKDGTERLQYYRIENTGQYINQPYMVDGKECLRKNPVQKKVFFPEDVVKEFSLNVYGKNVEADILSGNFTQIPNYYIYFWQPFIKSQCLGLFLTLLSHCYQRDYCFPSLNTLAAYSGHSKNTIKKYLDVLEEYGLIFRFNVINPEDDRKHGHHLEDTPLIKVRNKVPFISKELLNKLPKELQYQHEKFMQKYFQGYNLVELMDQLDSDSIYTELREQGMELNNGQQVFDNASKTKNRRTQILKHFTPQQIEFDKILHEKYFSRLHKASFDTWIKSTLFKAEGNKLTVYSQNDFIQDRLKSEYMDIIENELNEKEITDFVYVIYGTQ